MTETLSYLTDEELEWLTHPRDGIKTFSQYSKYLPQPNDIHEFLREKRARIEAIQPARTIYKRLTEEQGPWDKETDYERKARVVKELLGYNPSPQAQQMEGAKRQLVPPTAEDMRNLKLKTPAAPPSEYLLDKLRAEGWPFIPGVEQSA